MITSREGNELRAFKIRARQPPPANTRRSGISDVVVVAVHLTNARLSAAAAASLMLISKFVIIIDGQWDWEKAEEEKAFFIKWHFAVVVNADNSLCMSG